jgi:hypothetical protein
MWGMAPSPQDHVPLLIRFLPPHRLRQEYPQLTIYSSAPFVLLPVSGDVMVRMLGNNHTPRLSKRFLQRIDSEEMGIINTLVPCPRETSGHSTHQ